jgi:hypothetical protein
MFSSPFASTLEIVILTLSGAEGEGPAVVFAFLPPQHHSIPM